jgi:hypothetical protein
MKRGTGAYPVDVGRLSNNRPRIQQFEYLPDRSSREKERRKDGRKRGGDVCRSCCAAREGARKRRPKNGSQRNDDAIFPLETLPGYIDCRVLSLGDRVQ